MKITLIEFRGEPAIEFDNGEIVRQSESVGELLRNLRMSMPEWTDDVLHINCESEMFEELKSSFGGDTGIDADFEETK
jgi:hypothetical protein